MGCGKETNELSNLVDSLNLIGCNLLFCINFAWFNGFLPFCKQDSVVSNTNDAHWVLKKNSCCDSVHIMLSFENTLLSIFDWLRERGRDRDREREIEREITLLVFLVFKTNHAFQHIYV